MTKPPALPPPSNPLIDTDYLYEASRFAVALSQWAEALEAHRATDQGEKEDDDRRDA